MDLIDRFRPRVEEGDAFETCLRLAIAANIVDRGAKTGLDLDEESIKEELGGPSPSQ